jgi:hypothetical protein
MKIQLERKLSSCPNRLTCSVCCQPFPVTQIRSLLFTNSGWLRGDVCAHCLRLGPTGVRETLQERAILLKRQSEFQHSNTIAIHQLATELMTCSQETVQFPSLVQWWLKWWEVWTDHTVELETARLGLSKCRAYPNLRWPENHP